MKTPDSKNLSRRELILGALAVGATTCQWNTTSSATRTKVAQVPSQSQPEPNQEVASKFRHLEEAIQNYKSYYDYIKEQLEMRGAGFLANPDTLESACFEPIKTPTIDFTPLDYSKAPSAVAKGYQDILPVLLGNEALNDIIIHPPSKAIDTGTICLWYRQTHQLTHIDSKRLIHAFPQATDSQKRILHSAEQLIASGIRFFGYEQGVHHSPATLGRGIILNSEQAEAMISSGQPAFEILQEKFPYIDIKGVSADRMNLANICSGAKSIEQNYVEELAPFLVNDLLIDFERAEAFFTFLMTKGTKGAEILRDLEHYASAISCNQAQPLDDIGPNYIDPAIHTQVEQMRDSLSNPEFLKVQGNQPFIPNVFALQYGALHTGIRTACTKQGITCIEINATPFPSSRLKEMHQEARGYYQGGQVILENVRRFKSSDHHKNSESQPSPSTESRRGHEPLF